MKSTPRIADSEWLIMKVIWSNEPVTASQIIEGLPKNHGKHPKTVKTLINRLLKKGVLKHTKQGREFVYRSAVPAKDCLRNACDSFLQKVFNGSVASLVAQYCEKKRLSPDEINFIKTAISASTKGK